MLAALVLSLVRPSILMRTLAMKNITEVRMQRQWKVRRQFQPTTNAERRWDQAYQHLLEWTLVVRKKEIRRYAALLHKAIFVMQAAEYGSLHNPISARQPVSVLVGRDRIRHGLRQTGT